MVLDKEIKTQLAQYLNLLESDIVLQTDLGNDDNSRKEGLLKEAEYLSGDDLEANQKDIATIDSNISSLQVITTNK